MLNDNLHTSNINKIPQNEKNFFIIKKNENYSKTIEIQINQKEEIILLNLFLILKSFSLNLKYLPSNFLITIKNNEDLFIVFNQDISFLKKMNYKNFLLWYSNQFLEDEKYLNENTIYSFNFTFNTNKKIDNLYPIYPWKKEILDFFWKNLSEEISYEEIIKNKDLLIEKLKLKIIKLEKKIQTIDN